MPSLDLYKTLGVETSATAGQIRTAFRRLVKLHHPDVTMHQGDGEPNQSDRLKEIGDAYKILGNPEKRREYDRQNGGVLAFLSGSAVAREWADMFGSLQPTVLHSNNGEVDLDISLTHEISLEIADSGGVEEIVSYGKTIRVNIPAGTREGDNIRLKKMGYHGGPFTKRGDLTLTVKFKPHETFSVVGDDLHAELLIPKEIARRGGKIGIPTLSGTRTIELPPDSKNGTMRFPGCGLQKKNGDGERGALVFKISIC